MSLVGLRPETVVSLFVAYFTWCDFKYELPFTVTSITDGEHSRKSLHYVGFAFDLRLPPLEVPCFVAELQQRLGYSFDVVLERDHVHVEFQPKA